MRILLILPYLGVGGTEAHALLLARYFRREGHGVTLAAPAGPARADFAAAGVAGVELPPLRAWTFGTALRRCRAAALQADVVHVHAAQEFCGGLRLAGYAGPLVFTGHGYHLGVDYLKAGMFLNPFCHRTIAVSDAELARFRRAGVRRLTRIVHGIDASGYGATDRVRARADLGLPQDAILAVAVGRLDRYKAVADLLRALAQGDSQVEALIAGGGPERGRLEAIARALGLGRRVRFLGWRDDVPRLLAAADVFVSASRREAFGLAAVEAMAAGLPLVLSDIPAHAEIAANGREALLCAAGQPRAFAQALALLASVPRLRESMARAARERAASFTWERMGAETLAVYESARAGAAPRTAGSPRRAH